MKRFNLLFLVCAGIVGCQSIEHPEEADTKNVGAIWDQWSESNPSWVEQVEPYRIVDNVYYVGSKGLGSYLIATDRGHILLDGGLPQNAPLIIRSIERLGFNVSDVRVLINSHAHFDHSGGLAALKEATGALLVAASEDKPALEGGYYQGSEEVLRYSAPKVVVDEIIHDGSTITIGETVIKANLTPGHSAGCTTWTMSASEAGKQFNVLFFCSASVAANRLEPPQYDGIVEDYRLTFAKTRNWRPDIPLSNHPDFYFKQNEKSDQLAEKGVSVFIDRTSFAETMSGLERRFVKALAKQRNYDRKVNAYAFDPDSVKPNDQVMFYLHGKIIEDQGIAAVSPEFGEYQYLDIVERFTQEGFLVFSEPRQEGESAQAAAERVAEQIKLLVDGGVPAKRISVVGASKGAFIASLVSQYVADPSLTIVLLAGCSSGVIDFMLEHKIALSGRVLSVRDVSDTLGAGSCQAVFDYSEGLVDSHEVVLDTGLSHGLIYRALDEWVSPTLNWMRH